MCIRESGNGNNPLFYKTMMDRFLYFDHEEQSPKYEYIYNVKCLSRSSCKKTSETISDSAECSMHSSHAELITPFLYNPCPSLLVCIDLGSQLGILMRHKLSSVYVL